MLHPLGHAVVLHLGLEIEQCHRHLDNRQGPRTRAHTRPQFNRRRDPPCRASVQAAHLVIRAVGRDRGGMRNLKDGGEQAVARLGDRCTHRCHSAARNHALASVCCTQSPHATPSAPLAFARQCPGDGQRRPCDRTSRPALRSARTRRVAYTYRCQGRCVGPPTRASLRVGLNSS